MDYKKVTAYVIVPTLAASSYLSAEMCKNIGICLPDHKVDLAQMIVLTTAAST